MRGSAGKDQPLNCCYTKKRAYKIKSGVKYNTNIADANLYGYNVTQLPILLISGSLEFVGHVKEVQLIRMKFEEIMREGRSL